VSRTWAKTRGLGIELENEAAEYVIRAERGAGAELRRMAEAGERLIGGSGGNRYVSAEEARRKTPVTTTLADLGIQHHQSQNWQRVAALPQEDFEERLADAKSAVR
jgi:hypothetical protein